MWAAALLLLGLAASATGSAQGQGLTTEERKGLDEYLEYQDLGKPEALRNHFDAQLLPGIERLQVALKARMRAQAERWMIELRAEHPDFNRRFYPLFIRQTAALSLWRSVPLDAADDARWLAAASQPQSCMSDTKLSVALMPLLYLRAVPTAEREAALAAELRRVERFGEPPSQPLAAPVADLAGDIQRAVKVIRAVGVNQMPPLVPALSDLLLGDENTPPAYWDERCAAAQWWLRLPANKADAAQKLAVMRHAQSSQAADFYNDRTREAITGSKAGVPNVASRFGVSGLITAEMELDAQGHVLAARIAKRDVSVPGLGALPPLAFETVYDAEVIARARAARFSPPDPAKLKDGRLTAQQEYQFNLK